MKGVLGVGAGAVCDRYVGGSWEWDVCSGEGRGEVDGCNRRHTSFW